MSNKASQPTLDVDQDGWYSPSDKKTEEQSFSDSQEQFQIKAFNDHLARSILQQKNISLQPDMMFGWRPKLPSCPLPLTYPNAYLDSLIKLLQKDNRYSIAYIGPKHVNSVQINQQYSYSWKYRDRYSLNLALVQQAIKNVGKQENNMLSNSQKNIKSNTTQLRNHHTGLQNNLFKDYNENMNSCNYNFLSNGNYSQKNIFGQDFSRSKRLNSSKYQSKGLSKSFSSQFIFDSQFQSGNLNLVVRVKKNEYDCFMRSDTNTKGHTNWYFFRVNNGNQVGQLKLNICNFTKTRNLYSKGMKPYVLQIQTSQNNKNQENSKSITSRSFNNLNIDDLSHKWSQDHCYEVNFVERYCRYGLDNKTYQLQFKYNFSQKNQTVYFAYAIPYTYSKLQSFIQQVSVKNNKIVQVKRMCQTLGGIDIPLLKITNPNAQQNQQNQKKSQRQLLPIKINKKAVLITGRIHPGQSNASYVLQGFIREILKQSHEANNLRNLFVFYIVPMLNPDGVIAGNFRTSYSGKDLNRQFKNMESGLNGNTRFIYPQVFYLNELSIQLKNTYQKGFQFYMDFHGHSVKKGLFCYGPQHLPSKSYFFKSRAFAKLIEQMHPIFSYKKSIFIINQHKKTTGRAHMLWKIKIPMTFTFQISNGLYEDKNKKDVCLNHKILIEAGNAIYKGFYRYIQLQLRLPKNALDVQKQKDESIKNTSSKRVINSSKSIRPILKQKIYQLTKISSKERKHQNTTSQNQITFQNNKSANLNQKEKQVMTLKNLLKKRKQSKNIKKRYFQIVNQNINFKDQDNEEGNQKLTKTTNLLSLFKQIKKQQKQAKQNQFDGQYQGGSDSQGSQQDLTKNQTENLFKQILAKNDTRNGYKMNNWRTKKFNMNMRKKSRNLTQKEQKQMPVIEQKSKPKLRISRLEQLSKPMNFLHGQMRVIRKGISVEYQKVAVAQKNFTLNL